MAHCLGVYAGTLADRFNLTTLYSPLAIIEKDLKAITLASEKARTFPLIEFRQKKYLGEDLKRVFPGMSVFSTTVHVPEFSLNFAVVDVPETLNT